MISAPLSVPLSWKSTARVTKRNLEELILKYKGAIHPLARLSVPLTPNFVIKEYPSLYLHIDEVLYSL